MDRGNLFQGLPDDLTRESFDELAGAGGVKIERIVSRGHRSPDGFWYEQESEEWVAVLAGRARLEIEGEPRPLELEPGDWVRLPARCRHRVASTDPERATVWIAVHYPGGG